MLYSYVDKELDAWIDDPFDAFLSGQYSMRIQVRDNIFENIFKCTLLARKTHRIAYGAIKGRYSLPSGLQCEETWKKTGPSSEVSFL